MVTEDKWQMKFEYDENKRLVRIEHPADLPPEQRMGLEIPFVSSLIVATQRLDDDIKKHIAVTERLDDDLNKHSRILNSLTIALIVLTGALVILSCVQIFR